MKPLQLDLKTGKQFHMDSCWISSKKKIDTTDRWSALESGNQNVWKNLKRLIDRSYQSIHSLFPLSRRIVKRSLQWRHHEKKTEFCFHFHSLTFEKKISRLQLQELWSNTSHLWIWATSMLTKDIGPICQGYADYLSVQRGKACKKKEPVSWNYV